MNSQAIRGWLLQSPKPEALRVTGADDQVHELEVARNVSWARLSETVSALRPELIEALDGAGKLLRAVRPAEYDDRDTMLPPSSSAASSSAKASPSSSASGVPNLEVFGRLLADAYRHANEVAFNRMVDLFEAVNRRSEALEKSLDATHKMLRRAWEDQLDAQAEAASAQIEAQKDPFNAVVGAFIEGQAAAAAQKPPQTNGNGKPNGAHKSAPNGKG